MRYSRIHAKQNLKKQAKARTWKVFLISFVVIAVVLSLALAAKVSRENEKRRKDFAQLEELERNLKRNRLRGDIVMIQYDVENAAEQLVEYYRIDLSEPEEVDRIFREFKQGLNDNEYEYEELKKLKDKLILTLEKKIPRMKEDCEKTKRHIERLKTVHSGDDFWDARSSWLDSMARVGANIGKELFRLIEEFKDENGLNME